MDRGRAVTRRWFGSRPDVGSAVEGGTGAVGFDIADFSRGGSTQSKPREASLPAEAIAPVDEPKRLTQADFDRMAEERFAARVAAAKTQLALEQAQRREPTS